MPATDTETNVAIRLSTTALANPDGLAVVAARKIKGNGRREYDKITFAELDDDSARIAAGLQEMGVQPGQRLVLLVRPGIDFISLVYALLKAGVVIVLIDPGMGRARLIECLADLEPDGFVALTAVQLVRLWYRKRFAAAKWNVTVGKRLGWKGPTLKQLRQTDASRFKAIPMSADDPAAIIFTTGSTGPAKGVLYRHGNFNKQAEEIQQFYGIQPGEVDMSGFPLFALFNGVMGVTTVWPLMDFTRPAEVDPKNIIAAVNDWKATQAFGSPALWRNVATYCSQQDIQLPTLKRVLTAGAPAPPTTLQLVRQMISEEGEVYTPYGATESLPVASISASEVLGETAAATEAGAGTCVGKRFPGISWKVVKVSDEPLTDMSETTEVSIGEIGEIMVCGEVVTTKYATSEKANALHKVRDGDKVWHRIGDLGYFDDQERFWFCGRKAHRVQTAEQTLYPVQCEAIINTHPDVYRSALVGVGKTGTQTPVLIVEPTAEFQQVNKRGNDELLDEVKTLASKSSPTNAIQKFLIHPSLPVDIRHNAKIFREKLADWATEELS